MDGQDYLDQISASNRPIKKKRSSFLSSKFFLVGAIGLACLIVIIIIGSVLSGGKNSEKNLSYALALHIDNTATIIKEYQSDLKSSNLRSSAASLSGVLADTSGKLTNYLSEKYNYKPNDVDQKIKEQATLEKDGLESDLFEAKINGVLDRIFTHKISYEISMLMTEEAKIQNSTKDETLQEIMSTSYSSLSTIYDKFNNYSETN
ncbi:hypothetical protein IKG41_00890 [Candidatus Saccharibacteria bacterium]|nr:hypothetical protein [Candidatus Saccharibacteria bacterium]